MRYPVLYYFYLAINMGVGIIAIFRFQKMIKPLKVVCGLLIYWAFAELAEFITASNDIHNEWIVQINNLVEVIAFVAIYYIWKTSERNGKLLISSVGLFVILWIIAKFTFEPIYAPDEITWSLSRLIEMSFGVYFFLNILREENDIPWFNNPKLLVTSSFVIYSAGAFFLFSLFVPLLKYSVPLLKMIYHINWAISIIASACYVRAFYCDASMASAFGRQQSSIVTPS